MLDSFCLESPFVHFPTLPLIIPTLPTKTFVSVSTSPIPSFEEHPSQLCQKENGVLVAENWEKGVNDDVCVIRETDKNEKKLNIGHSTENYS